jgi:hypothetical protein
VIWLLGWVIIGMLFAALDAKEVEKLAKGKAKDVDFKIVVLIALLIIAVLNILFWPLFLFVKLLNPFRRENS